MTIFSKIINFFQTSFLELRKVSWPTRPQLISHTILVILSIVISMLVIALLDLGLSKIFQYLF